MSARDDLRAWWARWRGRLVRLEHVVLLAALALVLGAWLA